MYPSPGKVLEINFVSEKGYEPCFHLVWQEEGANSSSFFHSKQTVT